MSSTPRRMRKSRSRPRSAHRRRPRRVGSAVPSALLSAAAVQNLTRERLLDELREHALVIGEVTLTSGCSAHYYVDAKRAILRPAGFTALGELVARETDRAGATAVGGMTMGADPVACAALAAGADVKAFFVRKEKKSHGLQRWVEGPLLEPGEPCLIVEDVVTTGGSTVTAVERIREEGLEIAG